MKNSSYWIFILCVHSWTQIAKSWTFIEISGRNEKTIFGRLLGVLVLPGNLAEWVKFRDFLGWVTASVDGFATGFIGFAIVQVWVQLIDIYLNFGLLTRNVFPASLLSIILFIRILKYKLRRFIHQINFNFWFFSRHF